MSIALRAVPLVLLCALIIAVPSVWAYWVENGVALCTTTATQVYPTIASDGAGGAIVTWYDYRGGNVNIYAQRVNASGAVQWQTDGVALCTATEEQRYPMIISDGAGGAIVTWQDYRNGNYDIYVQRVDAWGNVQWTTNGVALCTATGSQQRPTIVSDGAGGAIVTWYDYRGGNVNIYAQRVNASGAAQWTADGIALCTATGNQLRPTIISDGAGGAIVTWYDQRGGNYDIYAQRVNAAGAAQWTADGVVLCTATGDQAVPTITSDGAGGAIVTWYDYRSGNNDIYAQRVNAAGSVQWTTDGVALCTATGDQLSPTISSDGASGAIVTWVDSRTGIDQDAYVQRVNAAGVVQWTADGVALCTATGDQRPSSISEGAGGAIVTWFDYRGGDYDIYAQGVNNSGAVQWTANGVALCTANWDQQIPTITSDGAEGAIVTWQDYRSGASNDIYIQCVNAHGQVGFLGAGILAVRDVPGDQGGWARITIEKSKLDDAQEYAYPISMYNVWLRIDDPALLALIAEGNAGEVFAARMSDAPPRLPGDASSVSGWPLKEMNGRYFVQSRELLGAGEFPAGTWELLGKFAACQQDQYIYRARTRADSTGSTTPYSVYFVSALTTTPSVWFVSEPDSGYSADNIAPETPGGLAGEQVYTPVGLALSWDVNAANDLSHYAVYRGSSEDFVPAPENRVATPAEPEYFDSEWHWSGGYYYKVSAVDVHGNESGFALLTPDDVTGTDTPKAPEATYLSQNYPNPFNPATRITFGLSGPGHVSLKIYDAVGRLVRVLINEERRPGRYEETWDGADEAGREVGSGIYFYRLVSGRFENTRKMILLR